MKHISNEYVQKKSTMYCMYNIGTTHTYGQINVHIGCDFFCYLLVLQNSAQHKFSLAVRNSKIKSTLFLIILKTLLCE